ncbi:MAG: KOW motif-containing protein [archaeon]
MHLKRQKSPRRWPITRKGTKYLVVPSHQKRSGVPLLLVLRDMLKLGSTRKELKKIMNEGQVFLNCKIIKNEKHPVLLFDTISFKNGMSYQLNYSDKRKFLLKEIKNEEQNKKIVKLIGKRILKGNKIQLNFNDGRSLLSREDLKVGNSVLLDLISNKILKKIELKDNSDIIVIGGKHMGKTGKIEKIIEERSMATIILKDKKINVNLNNLIAV